MNARNMGKKRQIIVRNRLYKKYGKNRQIIVMNHLCRKYGEKKPSGHRLESLT